MTKPSEANHQLAREKVTSGVWRVDPDSGHVIGQRGAAFSRVNSWGYIQIKFRDPVNWRQERSVLAHRVIWEAMHGPLANGLTINHINGAKTDNRIVNLEAVTMAENMQHAVDTGLHHALKGSENGNARLTEAAVLDIKRRCTTERVADLAREYGVAYWTVSGIKHGRSWRHVAAEPAA